VQLSELTRGALLAVGLTMRSTSVVAVALAVTLFAGCASLPPRKKIALGAAMTVAGIAMVAASEAAEPETDSCPPSSLDCATLGGPLGGLMVLQGAASFGMLVGGLGEMASGVIDLRREDARMREANAKVAVAPPARAKRPTASPAAAILDPARLENRLAIQASVTARAGHCEAARMTALQLSQLDVKLFERLRATDEQVAACLVTPPPGDRM
jgi:hypothetical protein